MGAGTKVLLTGFGPFPGVAANATAELVPRIAAAARARLDGANVRHEILATAWDAAPARLMALLDEFDPVLALHFGVSERARGFVVERTARNVCSSRADACGAVAGSDRVVDGGPVTLNATLPADAIVERLALLGLPAAPSDDAGGYLCNAVLYHSLSRASALGARRGVGFIHVPADIGGPGSALNWDSALRGGVEIVSACLEMRSIKA